MKQHKNLITIIVWFTIYIYVKHHHHDKSINIILNI